MSSYGSYSLEKVTEIAEQYDVDAVFLTDNLNSAIQYGQWPLRNVLWLRHSKKSIMSMGAVDYLEAVTRENERQTNVLYVAGMEVCPRYYWTGSIVTTNLVCHDHQRNIIALGVDGAEVMKNAPEVGGYRWSGEWGIIVLTRMVLAVFFFSVLLLIFAPAWLAKRSGFSKKEIRKSMAITMVLPALLLMVSVDVLAGRYASGKIYGLDAEHLAEKGMIDYLSREGIVHYWAHPEATDEHEFIFPRDLVEGIDAGIGFRADTREYAEVLLATDGYTGFGGVYEGKNTLYEPGAAWDKALWSFCEGGRESAPWCFGEMLYHYEGQAASKGKHGKKMGNVETMVWAEEPSREALLSSMRAGDFYSRRNDGERSLSLDRWHLSATSGVCVVDMGITSRGGQEVVELELIRNWVVVMRMVRETPVQEEFKWVGKEVAETAKSYFRLIVRGSRPVVVVSNPLFYDQ